jgi:RNA polymerase sigma-70 factor, ECF subfamily
MKRAKKRERGAEVTITGTAQCQVETDEGTRKAEGGDSRLIRSAVARAQEGDMEAMHFIYVRYSPDVLNYVNSLVKDHHEAQDITQSVFVKLPSAIRKYEPRQVPFAAWILRVARNAALDHLRARRAVPCEEVRVQADDRSQIAHERRTDLRRALEQLPGEQRDVLILRHIVGLSPVEIADRLGKTESSVHGLHHRGRRSLRAALEGLGAAPVVSPSSGS